MDTTTYLKESARTCAEGLSERNEISIGDFATILQVMQAAGLAADVAKKNMFYGKPIPYSTEEEMLPSIDPRILRNRNLENLNIDLVHAVLGIFTEASELAEALYWSILEDKPLDRTKMIDETGDTLWYIALGLRALGGTFEEAFGGNIAKLKVRFPEKFSEDDALNRDEEAELQALTA